VTQNIYQSLGNHRSTTSRAASAAGRLCSNGVSSPGHESPAHRLLPSLASRGGSSLVCARDLAAVNYGCDNPMQCPVNPLVALHRHAPNPRPIRVSALSRGADCAACDAVVTTSRTRSKPRAGSGRTPWQSRHSVGVQHRVRSSQRLSGKRISVEALERGTRTLHPYTFGVGDLSNINPSGGARLPFQDKSDISQVSQGLSC
jgi:hypothetical protein